MSENIRNSKNRDRFSDLTDEDLSAISKKMYRF